MPYEFQRNELVWAKLKVFTPWPAKIVEPTELANRTKKENCKWVYFFGTRNYDWVEYWNLRPYFEFKKALITSSKDMNFTNACFEIDSYILDNGIEYNEKPVKKPLRCAGKRYPPPMNSNINEILTITRYEDL